MRALIVAVVALSLTSCSTPPDPDRVPPATSGAASSSGASGAPQQPSLAPTASASAGSAAFGCDDPRISQQEFARRCAQPSARPLIQVARGASFSYLARPLNSAPEQWRIRVQKVSCWRIIDQGVYLGGGRFGRVRAPAGKKVCILNATHTNTGDNPGDASRFDALVTDKGQFAQVAGDDDIGHVIEQQDPRSHYYDTLTNPRESKDTYQAWTIPADATPIAVLFPFTTVFAGPSYRVALPPVFCPATPPALRSKCA